MINKHIVVLRSPDATEGYDPGNDPLAQAASGVEAPKYPVLAAERLVTMKVVSSKIDTAKEGGKIPNYKMLVLKLVLTKDSEDRDGKPLRAGFSSFKRIGLTEVVGDPTKRDRTLKDNIGPELAQLLRACFGKDTKKTARELINNPAMLEQSVADWKTSIIPGKDGFPDSNGFAPVPPA